MRVDAATSTWLQAEARTDFHAETANARRRPLPSPLWASALHDEFFAIAGGWAVTAYGIFPRQISRFLLCLGIHPNICPKLCPDKNPSVERLHRTLNQECLQIRLPITLGEVREATEEFLQPSNHERPQEVNGLRQSPTAYCLPKLASPAAGGRRRSTPIAGWRRSTGGPLPGKWALMVAWMSMTSITTSARHWQATRRVLARQCTRKGLWGVAGRPGDQVRCEEAD